MTDICWKIETFHLHYGKRMLAIASRLADSFLRDCEDDDLSESGFVVLSVGLMYLEPIAMFLKGEDSYRKSEEFFKFGFRRIFAAHEANDEELELLWKSSRNGMFHSGMQKYQCHLSRKISTAFKTEGNVLIINPAIFINRLVTHLNSYCENLREMTDTILCHNFESVFDNFSNLAASSTSTLTTTTPEPCANYYRSQFDS